MSTTPSTAATTPAPVPTQTILVAAQEAESFFSSSAFHNHIRTWTFIILSICLIGFLYVHESNANAATAAVADQIVKAGNQQQASIDKQIASIHEDTKSQVADIKQQIQQVQSVSQAIASIRATVPPVTITPLITQPAVAATATAPAVPEKTTASLPAAGPQIVGTITGDDLKLIADSALQCKAQSVELNSCKQTLDLEKQKEDTLTQEVTALKKVKIQPAWKKTLITVGQVAVGILIGKVL